MFSIGDKVVHPMHGAGVIDRIVTERINGVSQEYYLFRMPVGGLTLKIPLATSHVIGLRKVIDASQAHDLLSAICGMDVDMSANWNQRYRENMQKLKSGDLYEVAYVIKGLIWRDNRRGLSTGERKMLHTARQILLSELVFALENENAEQLLSSALMEEMVKS